MWNSWNLDIVLQKSCEKIVPQQAGKIHEFRKTGNKTNYLSWSEIDSEYWYRFTDDHNLTLEPLDVWMHGLSDRAVWGQSTFYFSTDYLLKNSCQTAEVTSWLSSLKSNSSQLVFPLQIHCCNAFCWLHSTWKNFVASIAFEKQTFRKCQWTKLLVFIFSQKTNKTKTNIPYGAKFSSNLVAKLQVTSCRMRKMNLSFAGCGFMGIYHVGVAACLRK